MPSSTHTNPRRPENFNDPWGNAYQYRNVQTQKGNGKLRKDRFMVPLNSDFDLYSRGADGLSRDPLSAPASHNDIIRANDGGLRRPRVHLLTH